MFNKKRKYCVFLGFSMLLNFDFMFSTEKKYMFLNFAGYYFNVINFDSTFNTKRKYELFNSFNLQHVISTLPTLFLSPTDIKINYPSINNHIYRHILKIFYSSEPKFLFFFYEINAYHTTIKLLNLSY